MREINVSTEELRNMTRNKYVASGSEASIYKYNDDLAIRIYDIEENVYCQTTGRIIGKPLCKQMIENLKIYQNNIKLTDFPIGIVKENNIVVGQIIKFYENAPTLTEFLKNHPELDPITYYLKVLDVLEELTKYNICYEDVHGGNFLVVDDNIKLIDFSDHRVKINETYNELYYNMFQNFNVMVNKINFKVLHLEDTYNRLLIPPHIKKDTQNLPADFEEIRNMLKNLKKTKDKKSNR